MSDFVEDGPFPSTPTSDTAPYSLGGREIRVEGALRPKSLSNFTGQKKIVHNISLMVGSAKKRGAAMDHLLLSGPPGLGKTSLAMIVAAELGVQSHMISAPAIDKKGDLAATLTNLSPGDVLFIDEIHRLPTAIEELLYSAMEDFRLDIILGQGASARTMKIDLAPFTLVGATTKVGLLSNPLRDRFTAHFQFEFYRPEELLSLLRENAKSLDIPINEGPLKIIARCCRGTPRIANRLLRRIRDYALAQELVELTEQEVQKALTLLGIDPLGLDPMDRKILGVINNHYGGGPVGIEALAATLNEERQTVEEVHEPFLLKEGLLLRTSRGRMLGPKGKKLLEESIEAKD